MAYDTIICDWNGTIIKDRDELPILKAIAVDLFKASIPYHPFKTLRILRAKRDLEALYKKRREVEFDFVREMFKIYNKKIINGTPTSFIYRSVDNYANKQQTQEKLDYRVLRAILDSHRDGKTSGIFSAGYKYGIQRILAVAGYEHCFNFYEANLFKEKNGWCIEFGLDIYKNKPQLLLKLLRERNLDERKVVYLGDSEGDEGCFEIVRYPVVAFFAPEELKERYARKYKAFVPEDEEDLARFLRRV
jgi:phosphoglycolate phosphatase-like HAD superfamily hydrolase